VSAVTGKGIDHLLEMILLQSEVLELKANPNRRAQGFVIEAQLEPGQGPTANLLVTNGTLKVGDTILCGQQCGKVRALVNDHGLKVKSAGPSMPIKCLGLPGVPEAGAEFRVCANERMARQLAEDATTALKGAQAYIPKKASLDALFAQLTQSQKIELKVILKADTQGSVEAITHALQDIKSEKVSLHIIFSSTGNITENDVMLASASNAVIMGFHVAKEPGVESSARHEGIEIRMHFIIYELLDQVREAMTGLLKPEYREKTVGRAEVRQVFQVGKNASVAGCRVTSGSVRPRHKVRLKRADEVLFQGALLSLKHFQESAAEVREGQECGIRLDGYSDFAVGDVIELYEVEEIKQTL
jgi:translation initiation factor IF-2